MLKMSNTDFGEYHILSNEMNLQTNISTFRIIEQNDNTLGNLNEVQGENIGSILLPAQTLQEDDLIFGNSTDLPKDVNENQKASPDVSISAKTLQNNLNQNIQINKNDAEYQQQNWDDYDEQLYQLLHSWNMAHLYQKFKDKKSSVETFKYFRYKHLDHFFKKAEIGERIPFEHHLFKWQRENNFYEEPYVTANDSTLAATATPYMEAPQLSEINEFLIVKSANCNNSSVQEILHKNESGREITTFYRKFERLLDSHRSTLVHLIVDYYINQHNFCVSVGQCRKLADEIILLFPKETKKTYFFGQGHSPPKGKLYDRFRNQWKKLKKFKKQQKPADQNALVVPEQIQLPNHSNLADEFIRIELKHLRTPWEEVFDKWKRITAFRIHQITSNKDNNLVNIFEQWPLYKHPQSPELVSSDFRVLFPNCQSIYIKWEALISKIPEIYEKSLKEKSNIKSFREILTRKHQMNIDTYNLEMVYLLPAILPPGVTTRKNNESKNIKYERSTILDSQLNFILKADTLREKI